jgi:hypothetical protein
MNGPKRALWLITHTTPGNSKCLSCKRWAMNISAQGLPL